MRVPWLPHGHPEVVREKRRWHDPVTGDQLTFGEELSWLAQGVIRRWTFLGLITVGTVVCWFGFGGRLQFQWNLAASYLALLIEGTVGIAMFSQTRRDAVILRSIHKTVKLLDEVSEAHRGADSRRDEIVEKLDELLRQKQGGGL